LRGDLERHYRNKSDRFAIEHFNDACVASVSLPKRGFVTRDGVSFEIETRSFELRGAGIITVSGRRIAAAVAEEKCFDAGWHVDQFNCFLSPRHAW
jgi:hypothetical protein